MDYIYKAFISYKHADEDFAAAEKVQNFLEQYRFPFSLRKKQGMKKFGRIYRDKTETGATSDLNDDIINAIRQSEYLVVICSKNTAASTWVDKEITTFIKSHSHSRPHAHILTVIVNGEPQEVIPQQLLHKHMRITYANGITEVKDVRLEPLSCDLRYMPQEKPNGQEKQETPEQHEEHELLRLAAGMLGCSLGELSQRMKVYLMQKIAIVSAIILLVMAAFLGLTFFKNHQLQVSYELINLQYNKIFKQNENIQESLARSLCDTSLTQLQQGYREEALQTVLKIPTAADPDEAKDPNEPLVPEQFYALNSALYSYEANGLTSYHPVSLGEAEDVVSGQLSSDGEHFWALKENGSVSLFSMEDGQQTWEIQSADIKTYVESNHRLKLFQGEAFHEIVRVIALDHNRAALFLPHCIAIVDSDTNEIILAFYSSEEISAGCCSVSGDYAVVWTDTLGLDLTGNEHDLTVYSLQDGTAVFACDLPGTLYPLDSSTSDGITCAVYYDAAEQLVFGIGSSDTAESDDYDDPAGLYVWNAEDDAPVRLSDAAPEALSIVNDHNLAVLQNNSGHYQAAVYDLDLTEDSCVYESDALSTVPDTYEGGSGYYGITLFEPEDDSAIPEIVCWADNQIVVVDANAMEFAAGYTVSASVAGINAYEGDRLLAALSDGSVITLAESTEAFSVLDLDMTVFRGNFFYSSESDSILLINDGYPVLCARASDSSLTVCEGADVHGTFYCETGSGFWRVVFADSQLQVFRIGEDTPVYHTSCSASSCLSVGLAEDESGTMYAAFVGQIGDDYCICKMNLTEAHSLFQTSLAEYSTLELYDGTICFTPDLSAAFILRSAGGAVRFDLTGDSAVPDDRALLASAKIAASEADSKIHPCFLMTGDGSGLLLFDENQTLWYYDIGQQDLQKFTLSDDRYSSLLAVGNTGSNFACTTESGNLVVVDAAAGSVRFTLPLSKPEECSAAFLDSDSKLLVCSNGTLSLYDLKNQDQNALCSMDISSVVTADSGTVHESGYDSGYILGTGKTGTWFTVQSNDGSEYYQSYTLFYVDGESNQFYRYAVIHDTIVSVCLDGKEVSLSDNSSTYSFAPFYTYAALKQHAEKILGIEE